MWWAAVRSSVTADDTIVLPPGPRSRTDDFVEKGLRFQPQHIETIRAQWGRFSERFGAPPAGGKAFAGRGIAMLGGKMEYLVPALVAIRALRKTGCTLPIELWLPDTEPRPPDVILDKVADKLGVYPRTLAMPAALGNVRAPGIVSHAILHIRCQACVLQAVNACVKTCTRVIDVCSPTRCALQIRVAVRSQHG